LKSIREVEDIILKVEERLLNALAISKLVLLDEKFVFVPAPQTLGGDGVYL
jgi:hypothetical protein